jgi:predicted nuclease with TOPRIM domain
MVQMEKEKLELQNQISELVRGSESKRAEIEKLRMECKHLRENKLINNNENNYELLIKEINQLRAENEELKIKLSHFDELAVEHAESASVSDTTKEQLLLLRNNCGDNFKIYTTAPSQSSSSKNESDSGGQNSAIASLPGPSGLNFFVLFNKLIIS